MDLKVLSDDGDVLRLALTSGIVEGALVPDTAPFERLLGRDGYARTVLMSLAQVNLIDSRCMGWLLIVHQRFREAGGKLVVHSIPPHAMEIVEILRFELVFHIAEDEAAALEMLRAADS